MKVLTRLIEERKNFRGARDEEKNKLDAKIWARKCLISARERKNREKNCKIS